MFLPPRSDLRPFLIRQPADVADNKRFGRNPVREASIRVSSDHSMAGFRGPRSHWEYKSACLREPETAIELDDALRVPDKAVRRRTDAGRATVASPPSNCRRTVRNDDPRGRSLKKPAIGIGGDSHEGDPAVIGEFRLVGKCKRIEFRSHPPRPAEHRRTIPRKGTATRESDGVTSNILRWSRGSKTVLFAGSVRVGINRTI